MNIEEYLKVKKEVVDNYIKKLLCDYSSPQEGLTGVLKYGLFAGGKRIRPILCLASGEAAGGKEELLLPAACAIEFIHNYSLIHDDLPCMDNDDYRRGKPSCHKKFNEPLALLAGDGLLTLAFEVLAKSYISARIQPFTLLEVIGELAMASGIRGMVAGQAMDLALIYAKLEDLEKLHKMKTGALIRASARIGALLGNASDDYVNALTIYAEKLGFAFQIVDDMLDFERDRGVNSFLSVYTPEEAKEKVSHMTLEAVSALKPLGEKAEVLKEIAWYFSKRSY